MISDEAIREIFEFHASGYSWPDRTCLTVARMATGCKFAEEDDTNVYLAYRHGLANHTSARSYYVNHLRDAGLRERWDRKPGDVALFEPPVELVGHWTADSHFTLMGLVSTDGYPYLLCQSGWRRVVGCAQYQYWRVVVELYQ